MRTGFVYELKSKDTSVTETYIGSCWDMKKRLRDHKNNCHNKKIKHYNYPLYIYIREHGGWDTVEMTIIDSGECEDELELHCAEQFYIDMSGGIENLLNGNDAMVLPEEAKKRKDIDCAKNKQRHIDNKDFYCEPCEYAAQSKTVIESHYTTNKHIKNLKRTI